MFGVTQLVMSGGKGKKKVNFFCKHLQGSCILGITCIRK